MASPHALLLPYPAQGHVTPLMKLAHCLVDRGFNITLINTEFNHSRVVAALSDKGGDLGGIHLVTVPDGLEPGEDRNDLGRLTQGILDVMPSCLEELIRDNHKRGEDKFTCFIVDWSVGWLLEVAQKMGLRSTAFWPSSPAMLAAILGIPKLIEEGIIDENGTLKRQEMISLSSNMPAINAAHLMWNCFGDSKTHEIIYNVLVKNNQAVGIAEFLLCNSFYENVLPAFISAPKFLPVGPLLTDKQFEKPVGHFWPEDLTCTSWLDEQPANSVIYVAFGSFTVFNQHQFDELALGLELTGRPFLWVVRSDPTESSSSSYTYPHGFRDRVTKRGRIVGWSPQQKVLAHPSIACFISHCGWNSTTETVGNGIPFLCWPYFADQYLNESYICDVWKVGLRLAPDESGIISRIQLKSKLEELLGNKEVRTRALSLKKTVRKRVDKGGLSYENLNIFAEAMKERKPVIGALHTAA